MVFTFRSPHAGAVPYLTSVTYSRPSLSTCLLAKLGAGRGGATSEIPPESRDKGERQSAPVADFARPGKRAWRIWTITVAPWQSNVQ
jgi:hypothetical protein